MARRVGQVRKRDANEPAIVSALEACGIQVWRLSGPGLPDLLTYRAGRWLPLEVKAPGGSLTPAQQTRQHAAPCPVVESVAEALAAWGLLGRSGGIVP